MAVTAKRIQSVDAGGETFSVTSGGLEWPYKFELVKLSELFIDESYQRPLSTFVNKIVENYDPHLLTPLIISKRGDRKKMAVVDGQTRMTALRQLGHEEVPSLIFEGNAEQEAMLFARFQSERKGIKPFHRHRAALKAGDETAIDIERKTREYGYEIGEFASSTFPWVITAVRALEDLSTSGMLDDVLRICSKAWPARHEAEKYGKALALSNEMLRGLPYFLDKFEVDEDRLVRSLSQTTPQDLTLRASHLRQGRGHGGKSPSYMSEAILGQYRKRFTAGAAA